MGAYFSCDDWYFVRVRMYAIFSLRVLCRSRPIMVEFSFILVHTISFFSLLIVPFFDSVGHFTPSDTSHPQAAEGQLDAPTNFVLSLTCRNSPCTAWPPYPHSGTMFSTATVPEFLRIDSIRAGATRRGASAQRSISRGF